MPHVDSLIIISLYWFNFHSRCYY